MTRARIGTTLERYKVRTLAARHKGRPQWAVFDGTTQVTNASGYGETLRRQRSLTIDRIEEIIRDSQPCETN